MVWFLGDLVDCRLKCIEVDGVWLSGGFVV